MLYVHLLAETYLDNKYLKDCFYCGTTQYFFKKTSCYHNRRKDCEVWADNNLLITNCEGVEMTFHVFWGGQINLKW